jgi:hypothetical protein
MPRYLFKSKKRSAKRPIRYRNPMNRRSKTRNSNQTLLREIHRTSYTVKFDQARALLTDIKKTLFFFSCAQHHAMLKMQKDE